LPVVKQGPSYSAEQVNVNVIFIANFILKMPESSGLVPALLRLAVELWLLGSATSPLHIRGYKSI
jgi:hypothetical protein